MFCFIKLGTGDRKETFDERAGRCAGVQKGRQVKRKSVAEMALYSVVCISSGKPVQLKEKRADVDRSGFSADRSCNVFRIHMAVQLAENYTGHVD